MSVDMYMYLSMSETEMPLGIYTLLCNFIGFDSSSIPCMCQLLYLPADRPHFFPGKMGPKLGMQPIRGYKRFDTSFICMRSHGYTLNWPFNVRFQLLHTTHTNSKPLFLLTKYPLA